MLQRPIDILFDCAMAGGNYNSCKKEFEKSSFRQYWILDKETEHVCGPLKPNEYVEKMKELHVPDSLKVDILL